MNNFLEFSIVTWQTRNWRHSKEAQNYCKNYGLIPLTRNCYAGKAKQREQNELRALFQKIFIGRTEVFYIFKLCQKCQKQSDAYREKQDSVDKLPFEIV